MYSLYWHALFWLGQTLLLNKRVCLNYQLLHNQRNQFISEKWGNFKAMLRGHTQCSSMYSFNACWLKRLSDKILLLLFSWRIIWQNIYCNDTLNHKLNFYSVFSLNRILFTKYDINLRSTRLCLWKMLRCFCTSRFDVFCIKVLPFLS